MTVNPQQIDVRKHFLNTFGKYEAEISARYIVRFCQKRGQGWEPFTYEDINGFYTSNGPRDSFRFNRLETNGFVTKENGFYRVTDEFVARCFRASLVVKASESDGKVIESNDKHVGSISQVPNDPRAMDPGKWHAVIHTAEDAITGLGVFDTEQQALKAALDGLVKNWTFDQWLAHWQATEPASS